MAFPREEENHWFSQGIVGCEITIVEFIKDPAQHWLDFCCVPALGLTPDLNGRKQPVFLRGAWPGPDQIEHDGGAIDVCSEQT